MHLEGYSRGLGDVSSAADVLAGSLTLRPQDNRLRRDSDLVNPLLIGYRHSQFAPNRDEVATANSSALERSVQLRVGEECCRIILLHPFLNSVPHLDAHVALRCVCFVLRGAREIAPSDNLISPVHHLSAAPYRRLPTMSEAVVPVTAIAPPAHSTSLLPPPFRSDINMVFRFADSGSRKLVSSPRLSCTAPASCHVCSLCFPA